MLRTVKQLLFALAMLALLSTPTWAVEKPAPQGVSGSIKWVFDYEEGKKLSAATGKPMFVVFRCER